MQDLNNLYYFVQVVDKQGFTAASQALDVPKSTISRRIAELEAALGVRLIQRNSRRFMVTDAGGEFYRHAVAMVIEAEAAENAVRRRLAEPRGTLRITCSTGMAAFALADLLPRFMAAFPLVEMVLHATNRYVDLVDEGFDLGLRAHSEPLPDSGLIRRSLARVPWALVAAPAYLDRAGMPRTPAELEGHAGLTLTNRSAEPIWTLRDSNGGEVTAQYKSRMQSDEMATLKRAAVAGFGILALPRLCLSTGSARRHAGARPTRMDHRRLDDQPAHAVAPRPAALGARADRLSRCGVPGDGCRLTPRQPKCRAVSQARARVAL